jgi:DMSO/TMAO reductase YedYZ heme-binding membrane subunit
MYFWIVRSRQSMKYLYTISFFADTLIFLCLSYLFFRKYDSGSSYRTVVLIFLGIVASIFLLVLLLRGYLKLPHDKPR